MGCAALLAPPQPASMTIPSAWRNQPSANAGETILKDKWWHDFEDPLLDSLIDQVLASNADLAGAAIRVRQAQLQASVAAVNPTISIAGNANNRFQRNLRGLRDTTRANDQSLTGTIGYEVDLWGKIANQRNAAEWEVLATMEDRDSAALALVGTTIIQYWRIANLHQRIAASENSLQHAGKILELVRLQRTVGAVSSLELLEAERSVTSQQMAHAKLIQALEQARGAMALLFDASPETRHPERRTLPVDAPPDIAAGLPAQMLGRRPDLRAAELRLRSALVNIDIARTSFYPALTLTGALGTSSKALSTFLRNPVATLGTNLVLPVLEWRQIKSRVDASQATYEAAAIGFRQMFYRALSDVENALSSREQLRYQADASRTELARAARIERLYRERYESGAEPLRVWLLAQEARRAAEMAVIDNDLEILINQVTVYQALGGSAIAPLVLSQ